MIKIQKNHYIVLVYALFTCTYNQLALGTKKDSNSTKQPSLSARKKEKNKQRRDSIPPKPPKIEHAFNDMTLAELKQMKTELAKDNNKKGVLKFLERMVIVCDPLSAERQTIMLELADLLFDTGDFEKASTTYQEFTKTYPGNNKVEYAHYKSVECAFKQIMSIDRDQTKTKEALELATTFLKNPLFVVYTPQITKIAADCQQHLFESETKIAQFYLNRGSFLAANNRINYMRTTFIDVLPACEPLILSLEIELATKMNDLVIAEKKKSELALKFPDAHAAMTAPKPVRLANRF